VVLHDVPQTVFGWKNSHPHEFRVGEIRFGMLGTDNERFVPAHQHQSGTAARLRSRLEQAQLPGGHRETQMSGTMGICAKATRRGTLMAGLHPSRPPR
jgi:hypothetical protein